MPKTLLMDFAEYRGIGIEKGATLFDVVFTMVQSELKTSEDETCDLVHQRLVNYTADLTSANDVLMVEGAVEVLAPEDHKVLAEEQQHVESKKEARKASKEGFKAKRSQSKRKPSYKKATLPSRVPQSQAKLYLPPNSAIWRDLKRGGWCAHVKPYKRVSELWEKHGDDHKALVAILRRCWMQRLEFDGQPRSACPIRGFVDDSGRVSAFCKSAFLLSGL